MCASQSTSMGSRDSTHSHSLKMPSLAATGKEIFPSWHEQGSACSGANALTLLFLQEEQVWNRGTGMGGQAASVPQGC